MMPALALEHIRHWGVRLAAIGSAAFFASCAVNSPQLSPADATGSIAPRETREASSGGIGRTRAAAPGKAKVALLLPLTGPGNVATVARAMKQAGEMALFERPSPEFQLLVKDDRGTPEGAKAAAEEALKEGAELILGPLLAASVDAVSPVAAAARVPVIAFSNDRRVIKPGTYLLSFMPEHDVERIVAYSASQGKRNFAALLPDDGYVRIVEEAIKRAVGSVQGNIAAIERYGRGGSSGMLEATRRLGEALNNPTMDGTTVTADALLVPGEPDSLASIGPLIAYARIDVTRIKLLGTGGWDAPNIGRDVTFVGAWYPAPDQRGWQSFSERFSKTFGAPPPRIASVAFDAVGIALALSGAPADARFTPAGITRPAGFQGADGNVRFLADGTATRALDVYEVQSFGSRVIAKAGSDGAAQPASSPPQPLPPAASGPRPSTQVQVN